MSFLGTFLSEIAKLPQKTTNLIGNAVSDVAKIITPVIVKVGGGIGEFVKDVPNKIKNEIGNNVSFVLEQVEKVQDLGLKGISKVGDVIVKNPVVGGVLAVGGGMTALTVAAIALGGIFILKKF